MGLKRKLKKGGYSLWKNIIFEGSRPVGLKKGRSVDVRYYDLNNVAPSAHLAKYCEENGIQYHEVIVGKIGMFDLIPALEEVDSSTTSRIFSYDSGKRR